MVTPFLAGDAVQLMRVGVPDNLSGLGTGKLRESHEIVVARGAKIYLQGISANLRGLSSVEIEANR